MKRPDLDTLACVNPACQLFRRLGEANLTVRKVDGYDRLRLLRCRRWPLGLGYGQVHKQYEEKRAERVEVRFQQGAIYMPRVTGWYIYCTLLWQIPSATRVGLAGL